jgi:hypothetical protein
MTLRLHTGSTLTSLPFGATTVRPEALRLFNQHACAALSAGTFDSPKER